MENLLNRTLDDEDEKFLEEQINAGCEDDE